MMITKDFKKMTEEERNREVEIFSETIYHIGRFARIHMEYLEEYKEEFFLEMMNKPKIFIEYLTQIQEKGWKRKQELMEKMAIADGLTEEMKSTDQLRWVGMMNNIDMTATRIVIDEMNVIGELTPQEMEMLFIEP